jgi:hypothetical protein
MDLEQSPIEFIVWHPFTTSKAANVDNEIVDLTTEVGLKKWREKLSESIDRLEADGIVSMFNPSYILPFLKYIKDSLDDKEMAHLLRMYWKIVEMPNMDKNVSISEIIDMFEQADKSVLMNDEEREVFENLPEAVTLYRGVTAYNKDVKNAVNWTTDKEQAQWFAERFGKSGEVWEKEFPKDKLLCYFKYENNVVVNTRD